MCLCSGNVGVFGGDCQIVRVAIKFDVGGSWGRSCRNRLKRAGERVDSCGASLCM